MRKTLTLIALMLMVSISVFAQIAAVPQLMNFQGRLAKPDGTPVPNGNYSVRFSLWTAATGGTEKWNQTVNVAVRNGTFAAQLNTSTGAADKFNNNLFLEIKFGNNAPLTPRQPLVSVAYAMKADSIKDGIITSASIVNGAVTGAKIADGTITAADLAPNALNNLSWLLNGNANLSANSFLGTTTNDPLTMKVNNRRAVQYTYAENVSDPDPGEHFRSINVLGGSDINTIATGVVGGTIAGGGMDFFTDTDYSNHVGADFGTVGGGSGNTAGYTASTVAGGGSNTSNATYSTIGGGFNNIVSGFSGTVPGGYFNIAQGPFSFAAGNHAQALHNGSFVWGDSAGAPFVSTAANQFLIRASGGVGINTNTPGFPLTFPDTLGDKISLFGQSGNHFGFGIAPGTLQIHTGGREQVIDFGYGRNSAFILAARVYGNGDFVSVGDNHAVGSMFAQGFFETSDARYKQNIAPLSNALESILNLRGVTFEWNREAFMEKRFREGKQIGFIAQEVEKVLPQLVSTDAKGYKSVAYQNVVPVLVEAVKQQQKQHESDRAENAALKRQLAELAEIVRELKAAQNELRANHINK